MNLLTLLDMVAEGHGERVALGSDSAGLTGARLRDQAYTGASFVRTYDVETVVFMGENGPAFPLALFAAAAAGVPLLPLNYRLAPEQLHAAVARQGRTLLITDDAALSGLDNVVRTVGLREWLAVCAARPQTLAAPAQPDADDVAVLLLTSGTTAAPKSAVLRHRHLTAYVLGSVEFGGSDPDEAVIVSVPPYHIAAIANLLSNLYSGRRVVYLEHFTAAGWLGAVTAQRVTHAMLVPTMLTRIVDELERPGAPVPTTLRSLSYGGARLPLTVLERALTLLPHTGFVNAYGLTETSSSVAVLGPDDHRQALSSTDPAVRARLGSVGCPLPSVDIEIRDASGRPCPPGSVGMIYVKGAQVAGEYRETGPVTDADGWFATRDEGHLDAGGYLFVRGRADDTIIRGGENIAPAEIEAVLQRHPDVRDVAVVGIADEEWGHRIGAFVVLKPDAPATEDDLRAFVRSRLRSSKTPDEIRFLDELPHTPTGKILRRELLAYVPQSA
ncbi:AMP-dependent synthetase [Streptomyces sp. AcH 505]|uniref:class I adenylate-forming enzyme family protein n=1 Tax=Streptomyces sp. AcH 505 TaxID=352211 RepID=UPI0005923AA2|nr:AMP-dependent synthetase [Streptomyces sp. AcH 505]